MAPRREWGSERPTPAQVTREQRAEPAVGSPPGTAANEALVGTPGGEGRGSGLATLRAGARPGQGAALAGCTLHGPPPHTPGLGRRRESGPRARETVLPPPRSPQGGGPRGAGLSLGPPTPPPPPGGLALLQERQEGRRPPHQEAGTEGWQGRLPSPPAAAPSPTGPLRAPASTAAQRAGPVASPRRGWWPDQSLGALPPALPHGSTPGPRTTVASGAFCGCDDNRPVCGWGGVAVRGNWQVPWVALWLQTWLGSTAGASTGRGSTCRALRAAAGRPLPASSPKTRAAPRCPVQEAHGPSLSACGPGCPARKALMCVLV